MKYSQPKKDVNTLFHVVIPCFINQWPLAVRCFCQGQVGFVNIVVSTEHDLQDRLLTHLNLSKHKLYLGHKSRKEWQQELNTHILVWNLGRSCQVMCDFFIYLWQNWLYIFLKLSVLHLKYLSIAKISLSEHYYLNTLHTHTLCIKITQIKCIIPWNVYCINCIKVEIITFVLFDFLSLSIISTHISM